MVTSSPRGTDRAPGPVRAKYSKPIYPRTLLAAVAELGGWQAEDISSKMFRHTYCAARLQTLDRGAPVSVYTVGKELGHGGDALVKRVYGHLGEVRHRAKAVEFRVEQHGAKL